MCPQCASCTMVCPHVSRLYPWLYHTCAAVVPQLCPQCAAVAPWLYHTCAAVVPVVFLAGNVPRGEARELLSAPPRPAHHQALSPKIHTTWKTQNNRQQQQGQNNQNTHTTSSQKNKRTIISKQAYRQKEFMRRYCMGGEGDPQTEIDTKKNIN